MEGGSVREVLASRRAIAIGACAVTAVLGGTITYAVAEPSPPSPHTFYACAHGSQIIPGSMAVDAIPSCSKNQTVVSWDENGAMGPTGATGKDGLDGAPGPAGPTGPRGADGHDGALGPVGATGTAGTNGRDGAQGPMGATGARGLDGRDGRDGAPGPAGPTGSTGATGPAGGPPGPTGPTGARGPTGANGVSGYQLVTKNGTAPHGSTVTEILTCPAGRLPVGGNAFGNGASQLAIRVVQSALIGTSWGVVIENTDAAADVAYTAQVVCVTAS
jgi:hypothetical protein